MTRAAATPRVLPAGLSLVTANSRVLLGGIVAVAIATPIGGLLLKLAGPEWSLRFAFVVFARRHRAGPARCRAGWTPPVGEVGAGCPRHDTAGRRRPAGDRAPRAWNIGPRVVLGLRAVGDPARVHRLPDVLPGVRPAHRPGLGLAPADRRRSAWWSARPASATRSARRWARCCAGCTPEMVVTAMLGLAAVGATVGALWYGLVPVLVTGLCAGLAAALGKLSLDALIQREVPEDVRSSAFARSETVLQLAWVVGGGDRHRACRSAARTAWAMRGASAWLVDRWRVHAAVRSSGPAVRARTRRASRARPQASRSSATARSSEATLAPAPCPGGARGAARCRCRRAA